MVRGEGGREVASGIRTSPVHLGISGWDVGSAADGYGNESASSRHRVGSEDVGRWLNGSFRGFGRDVDQERRGEIAVCTTGRSVGRSRALPVQARHGCEPMVIHDDGRGLACPTILIAGLCPG